MTSNIGLQNLNKGANIGFEAKTDEDKMAADQKYNEIKEQVLKDLRQKFKPELLNRIDKIIVYKPLSRQTISKIVSMQLKELDRKLAEQKLKLTVDKNVVEFITEKSYLPDQGARAVRRNIQEMIESNIASGMLDDKFKSGDTIKVKVKNNEIALS